MIITLLACIYISIICWCWGYLLMQFFGLFLNKSESPLPVFSIICLTGLSILAVVSGLYSLFMPLGGISIQIILLLPALALLFTNKNAKSALAEQLRSLFLLHNPLTICLLLFSLIAIFIMNAWVINHPDTIAYHLQTKQWIEDYKAVPGIVHLDIHLGYQGLWYVLCALFSFKFINSNAPTFINSAVILWYILFIIKEISNSFITKDPKIILSGALYSLLFAISAWDYGQVRLTSTSLSPDFVAGLYVWAIFYLLFSQYRQMKQSLVLMLIVFLATIAITIKLSTIPVIILMLYALYHLYTLKKRAVAVIVILVIISIVPFVARNIISSGYIIFPSAFPDIVNCDWKYSKEGTKLEKDYISAYARIRDVSGKKNIEATVRMKLVDWLPVWWSNRSSAEKFYVSSLLLLLPAGIVVAGKVLKTKYYGEFMIGYIASAGGIIFWFFTAPDPRFAYGFLIPVQGICLYFLLAKYAAAFNHLKQILLFGLAIFCVIICAYSAHRCIYYFKPVNIYSPAGVQKVLYRQEDCGGIKINMPVDNSGCRNIPVPCVNSCDRFLLRGKDITDGFKAPLRTN